MAHLESTLKPVPVCHRHLLSKWTRGVNAGDSFLADVPRDTLLGSVHSEQQCRKVYRVTGGDEVPVPEWVEPQRLQRAQEFYQNNAFMVNVCLTKALNAGFCISRFAEVLVRSGYARTPRTTLMRFHDTAHQVIVWMSSPLLDAHSPARLSLFKVRCMHEHARKMSRSHWHAHVPADSVSSIGVPLSQYDMALVQLAFSGVMLDILKTEMDMDLPPRLQDDFIHLWRFIGYLLGVEEEYNACMSSDVCHELTCDLLHLTPFFVRTRRPACVILADSFYRGLSYMTGRRLAYAINYSTRRDFYDQEWAAPFTIQSPAAVAFHRHSMSSLSRARTHWLGRIWYNLVNRLFYHFIFSAVPLRLYRSRGNSVSASAMALYYFFYRNVHELSFATLDFLHPLLQNARPIIWTLILILVYKKKKFYT